MKKFLIITIAICSYINGVGQDNSEITKEKILKELADNSCKCIDSISTFDKSKKEIAEQVNACITKTAGTYQMSSKLLAVGDLAKNAVEKDGKKEINISIEMNENSQEFKKFYYEVERYLMNNCAAVKSKISTSDKVSNKSFSENEKAQEFYQKGIDASTKENHKKAIGYFKKAVENDPEFAFAWDNMGLSYRKLNDFDNALMAYKRSLEIDPQGTMPLQNIAIVYQYTKEYDKAINAYEKLAEIDKNNPEIYYGIGQIYATALADYEKGLQNICKAYLLYIEQKSPYRADAEKIIQMIYAEMKKQGKVDAFNEILKQYNISH